MDGKGGVGGAGFPRCRECGDGDLLPLSDYGRDGASIHWKAWVCSGCGWMVRIDNGEVSVGRVSAPDAAQIHRDNFAGPPPKPTGKVPAIANPATPPMRPK